MKTHRFVLCWFALATVALVPAVHADYHVNISVKVICKPNGARPIGGLAELSNFGLEVNHANAATVSKYGYRISLVEFVDITPPVPAGQSENFWFSMTARSAVSRNAVHIAATNDPVTWKWNTKAINFYINDTSSGICAFPSATDDHPVILLGKSVVTGTVIHEIGHWFNLLHTHPGDSDGFLTNWGDGDGLIETLPDDPDATLADIHARYPNEPEQKRLELYHNIMSYHQADYLLPAQFAVWDATVAFWQSRRDVLSPVTIHVATFGSDVFGDGSLGMPYQTVTGAGQHLAHQRPPYWTILLVGSPSTPPTFRAGSRFAAPCRLVPIGGTTARIAP
jgi:hypothetical protein